MAVAAALLFVIPRMTIRPAEEEDDEADGRDGQGFGLLLAIGACDTATRMGYLLFLPFLIHEKGGSETTVGIGLALIFAGGALGKATCGWLGQKLGVVWSVIATEAATALIMVATLAMPLMPALVVLPFLGIVLNGTSSILYGTVPDLAKNGEVGSAFAKFYTGVIGAGGLAPIAYGVIADQSSRAVGVVAAALTAAVIIPMVLVLGDSSGPSHNDPPDRRCRSRVRDRAVGGGGHHPPLERPPPRTSPSPVAIRIPPCWSRKAREASSPPSWSARMDIAAGSITWRSIRRISAPGLGRAMMVAAEDWLRVRGVWKLQSWCVRISRRAGIL